MVNWKSNDNQQRLIATLLVANPGLKLDYLKMAALFGQGATYYTIKSQFRKYREQAKDLKKEAAQQGISFAENSHERATGFASASASPMTPRAPRTGARGEVMKSSSSAGKGKKGSASASKATGSPTKGGPKSDAGENLIEAIFVEDDDDDDEDGCVADSFGVLVKSENTDSCVLPSIESPVIGLVGARIKTEYQGEGQDMGINGYACARAASSAVRSKSRAPRKDFDGYEIESAPASFRDMRESAPDRSLSVPRRDCGYETDTTDGVA
ncbi:hypothetical protein BJX63DRAFT_432926 [Aspergillus granulosus]|uniref:Uncharacterized protein n=1 Tax=Aspergillus granulosus TaxID=176169 RepID=A0ABR4H9X5_9EURO